MFKKKRSATALSQQLPFRLSCKRSRVVSGHPTTARWQRRAGEAGVDDRRERVRAAQEVASPAGATPAPPLRELQLRSNLKIQHVQ